MTNFFELTKFSAVDLNDPFFDSLRSDYVEFEQWFRKKSNKDVYVLYDEGEIRLFLYLKVEDGPVTDVSPPFESKRRIKIGTMKVDPHGTRLGERCIKKAMDFALYNGATEIYVTIFPRYVGLVSLLETYGFRECAVKTTQNGVELVLVKRLGEITGNVLLDYPIVDARRADRYMLAIYPEYHSRLVPDSILTTENFDAIQDVSHTNSIHKVYVCCMDMPALNTGDILVMYRTSDIKGRAWYRAVATSICVVQECKAKEHFKGEQEFLDYCVHYSVFSERELKSWYRSSTVKAIKMTYNIAMRRRLIRKSLVEDIGLDPERRWDLVPLTDSQFKRIAEMGDVYESLIVY